MPKLAAFVGSDTTPARHKSGDELCAIGLRWHYALNARQKPKK